MQSIPLFRFLARPLPTNSAASDPAGGYICAWVNRDDVAIAEQIARGEIEEAGWHIDKLEETAMVSRDSYNSTDEGLRHFEQALIDGCVLEIHCWPHGAPDGAHQPV